MGVANSSTDPVQPAVSYRYDANLPAESKLLEGLLKTSEIQQLFESYYNLIHIPVAIIDLDANVLFSSQWQRICTQFHRPHPETCKRCIESDTKIALQLKQGQSYTIYACLNGLTDCASPIILEGRHIANVFVGQFFTKQPDENYFRRQAKEFGFDAHDYLDAVRDVPVVEEKRIPAILDLLMRITYVVTRLSVERRHAIDDQSRQKVILDTIPQSIFWKDLDGKYLGCNSAFAKVAGLDSPNDIVGKSDFDLPWPRSEAETYRAYDQVVISSKQEKLHIIEPLQKVDGSRLIIDTSKIPLIDEGHTLRGVVGIYDDITERKRTEESLRASEERYRSIVENAQEGIITYDRSWNVSFINARGEEIFGYKRGELLGRPVIDVIPEEDRTAHMERRKKWESDIQGVYEACYKKKDGTQIWLQISGWTVFEHGEFAGFNTMFTDITVRKQADQLRSRMASIVESSEDAIISKTLDGVVASWNRGAEKLFGFTAEEIVGKPMRVIIPQDRVNEEAEILHRIARGETVEHYETVLVTKTGESIDVSVTISPLRDDRGKIVGASKIARDISGSKRNDAIKNSNLHIIQYATSHSLDDLLEETLNEAEKLSGSLIGFYHFVEPDQQTISLQNWSTRTKAEFCRAKGKGEHYPISQAGVWAECVVQGRPVIHNDYASLPNRKGLPEDHANVIRELVVPVFRNGVVKAILGVGNKPTDYVDKDVDAISLLADLVWEIADRKQAEEKIKEQAQLLEIANDAIIVCDMNDKPLFWNKAAEKLYGWTFEQVSAIDVLELIAEEDKSKYETCTKEFIEKGEWEGEFKQRTKDGRSLITYSRWTLVRDREGKPSARLIITRDFTEQRSLEAQFRRAQRLENLGSLAGGIAHDLNNVLAPVLLASQVLEKRSTDKQIKEITGAIEKNIMRGRDIIKQILLFARGGEEGYAPQQVKYIIDEMRSIIRETFPKNINLRINVTQDLYMVVGDGTQLHQVFMNLCVNARDAMPDGGQLKISASNIAVNESQSKEFDGLLPGDYVFLTISDTGSGIPKEIQKKIFEPFFTTKEIGKGTGLGLSTVVNIIKSHKGFFNLHSEVGKGTEFRIYLPSIREEAKAVAVIEEKEMQQAHGETILLVDDELAILHISKETLETYGFNVITAGSGIEALRILSRTEKDLIRLAIVDINMPGLNGCETIAAMRQIIPHLPTILSTGSVDIAIKQEIEKSNIQASILKPYTARKLLETVSSVIKGI